MIIPVLKTTPRSLSASTSALPKILTLAATPIRVAVEPTNSSPEGWLLCALLGCFVGVYVLSKLQHHLSTLAQLLLVAHLPIIVISYFVSPAGLPWLTRFVEVWGSLAWLGTYILLGLLEGAAEPILIPSACYSAGIYVTWRALGLLTSNPAPSFNLAKYAVTFGVYDAWLSLTPQYVLFFSVFFFFAQEGLPLGAASRAWVSAVLARVSQDADALSTNAQERAFSMLSPRFRGVTRLHAYGLLFLGMVVSFPGYWAASTPFAAAAAALFLLWVFLDTLTLAWVMFGPCPEGLGAEPVTVRLAARLFNAALALYPLASLLGFLSSCLFLESAWFFYHPDVTISATSAVVGWVVTRGQLAFTHQELAWYLNGTHSPEVIVFLRGLSEQQKELLAALLTSLSQHDYSKEDLSAAVEALRACGSDSSSNSAKDD